MEQRYQIEQYSTTGWEPTDHNLTKEDCDIKLQSYLADGQNPQYIRVRLYDESNS